MDAWFSSQIKNSTTVVTLFLGPTCSASTMLCTYKSFHRQTNFSNTSSERILLLENLENVQTNKQTSRTTGAPFPYGSGTLNKRSNKVTFSGSWKSGMCHVLWRIYIQVSVVTYTMGRTIAYRTELKVYWHFRHSSNDQEIEKEARKMSFIIKWISQKISLEIYTLYGKEISEAVNL